jgi:hypothetical protein
MWQLFDIAYVIPACVALGYWVGKLLETRFAGEYSVISIMLATLCGFILTIAKIKRYVDSVNKKNKSS